MEKIPLSEARHVRRTKRCLVLDVFLNRGATWEYIRDMREHWSIEARTQIPSRSCVTGPYPPESLGPRPEEEDGEQAERWFAKYDEWTEDLAALYKMVVPEEARDSEHFGGSGWESFLSMCVLFDPPETQLEDFAERIKWGYSDISSRDRHRTSGSPIVWRQNSLELEDTWMEFYEGLLRALLEKYVHPQGVATEEAIRSIKQERPEIFERWRQRLHDNESRPLIDVRPYHTRDDIDLASQELSARHETRPAPGREKRDELTAVQCAILHNNHNRRDPADGRRRMWSFARLAETFGLESARAAKDHVMLGRDLLDQYRGR